MTAEVVPLRPYAPQLPKLVAKQDLIEYTLDDLDLSIINERSASWLSVGVHVDDFTQRPTVFLQRCDQDIDVELTAAQAARLGRALLAAAKTLKAHEATSD